MIEISYLCIRFKLFTNMKCFRFIGLSILLMVLEGVAVAQPSQKERLTRHVYYFASDSLKGRCAGTVDADKAARYIVREFEEMGLAPFFEDGYYQPFEKYGTDTYKNVVGLIPGNDPVLKDEYIIIGAHYDHVGIKDDQIYNGADDNASGAATLIEMARILKEHQGQLKRSVIVAAFDAEEKGLWGSDVLASTLDLEKVKLMMSIDMVGWLHKGKTLQLQGVATIRDGKKLVEAEARKMQLDITAKHFETSIMGATDTQSFAKRNVPTLYATTGLKSPYHKPEDDAELIDYQGLDRITSYMADVTECLATQPDLQASGKIAAIHNGKRKAFEIGPTIALVNGSIAFPDAAFNGKPAYGLDAGLTTHTRLGRHLTMEVKALYERLNAKYPDENDMYGSSLPYHQESVLAPVNLLYTAGEQGLSVYFGVGGYYGYVLNGEVRAQQPRSGPSLVIDKNQYGLTLSVGLQLGRIKFSGESRYQLNPLFVGEGNPKARMSIGTFGITYLF